LKVRVTIKWFLFLFVLPFGLVAQTTGSIQGKVYSDEGTLEFVNVVLKNTAYGTITNGNGTFRIDNIPTGNYKIKASFLGFQQTERNITVTAGKVSQADFKLSETDSRLDEVVVTGTLKEVSKANSPIPVEIFTPKLFRKNPTNNIFESLQMVNGVQPQINCNVCGTGDIHINGMEGAYTMVTIDGMPIVSSLSTVYGLMGIPNSMVQRIEVVKGPASTLYGSEAVAGVINIITKTPQAAPLFSADIFSTTQGEVNADISMKAKMGKANTLLGVNGFFFNHKLDVNHDNFTDVPLQKRYSIFNKWSFNRNDKKNTSVAVRWFHENRWGGEMQWTKAWRGTDSIYGESIYTKRVEVIGNYDLPVKENIKLQYSYNYHNQNSVYGTVIYNAVQHISFTQLLWNKKLGERNDLLVGVPFRYQYYDDNTPVTASETNSETKNKPDHIILPGIFVQDEIMLHEKFTTLVGLRYDHNSRHGNILSPRISFRYKINEQNTLRLSGGNGYRVVNLFTEDHAALTGSREVVIKENLKPERSWNVNLNYNRFITFKNGFIGLDASLFYTYFTNKITGDFITDAEKIIYSNLNGHAISRGGSLNADVSLANGFKFISGFTIADVYRIEKDSLNREVKMQQLHNSLFSATFSISYTIKKPGITFDLTGRVNGPMLLPVLKNDYRPDTSPWYGIINFQATKSFKFGLEIYAGVKNLLNFMPQNPLMRPFDPFDKTAADTVSNPEGYTFDTTYNYAPMQGIRGFFGVRYTIHK
jgi:outer membrane receptor for ferrienterochelin and colicins